ncbi:MAG: hypothetical protein MI740_10585 [Halanaerobiales bacterium]|nr:hypothetical protein [Halanaerobiales bacterium]
MRKRRMDLEVYPEDPCVLWDTRSDDIYIYVEENEKFHQKYGGKKYYSSWTGKTQAGFIEEKIDDLIKLGYYDPHRSLQKREVVGYRLWDNIWGYAPVIHNDHCKSLGDGDYPYVLTDSKRVAFVSFCEMRNAILNWKELFDGEDVKSCAYEWFNPDGIKWRKEFRLYNPDKYCGVNAARFIDLREEREICRRAALSGDYHNLLLERLNILPIGDFWFQQDSLGIFTRKWDIDPRDLEGEELLHGWIAEGNGLFYRRNDLFIEAFMDVDREKHFPRYTGNEHLGKYIDYEEEEIPLLSWTSKSIEEWKEYFHNKILRKARKDWVYAERSNNTSEDIHKLMIMNMVKSVSIQDSLDTGNCDKGSKSFAKKWGIELSEDGSVPVDVLLHHPQIKTMLNNFAFRKVVHYALS